MDSTKLVELDTAEVYGLRLLVFLEHRPQSNDYKQLILNTEQFKRLSELLVKMFPDEIFPSKTRFNLSSNHYQLPDPQDINYGSTLQSK